MAKKMNNSGSSPMARVGDVGAWLAQRGKVSVGVHSPKTIKGLSWPCCSRCCLLYLRNDVTAKAILGACVVEE